MQMWDWHCPPSQYCGIGAILLVGGAALGHVDVEMECTPPAVATVTSAPEEEGKSMEPPAIRVAVVPNGSPWMGTRARWVESAAIRHDVVLSPACPRGSHVGDPSPRARMRGADAPGHRLTMVDMRPPVEW